MTDIWNIREVRSYTGFQQDPVAFIRQHLSSQFNLKNLPNNQIEGVKKGVHINFTPEISILISTTQTGRTNVSLHYFAKLAIGLVRYLLNQVIIILRDSSLDF